MRYSCVTSAPFVHPFHLPSLMTADLRPIQYDISAALVPEAGVSPDDVADLAPRLQAAREEVIQDEILWKSDAPIPPEKSPLDAGFMGLPERLLEDYEELRGRSELGRILSEANRIAEEVDQIVVLGIGGSYMGARALFNACCHPYHNELTRGERGSRPKIYFCGNNVDNDSVQGLLDLLARKNDSPRAPPWAIAVISKSGGTLETAVAFRTFLRELSATLGDDQSKLSTFVLPVTGESGRLFELANTLGCSEIFHIPKGVGGRFSIFSPVGLLPAAILGLDVVKLLQGARQMNEVFRRAPPGENIVLDFVGICHLLETQRGMDIRVLSTWGDRLEPVGYWYDQLLAESLGKEQRGATPITTVNTRDLHSRGQQHQEGRRDKLITNLFVDEPKRDSITVGNSKWNEDQLNELAEKTYPDILQAAFEGTNMAYAEVHRPTATIRLPSLDESPLGQLFQMLMLATIVEGRLIGINPYGQPGVEAYKRHMNAKLREER